MLLSATISCYEYTSFGVTSWLRESNAGNYTVQPRSELDLPTIGVEGNALACVKVNSTQPFLVEVYLSGQLTYNKSSTGPVEHCTISNYRMLTPTIINLSSQPAIVGVSYDIDGAPIRSQQMLFAPNFTLLPMLVILLLSSKLGDVKIPLRRGTLRSSWVYYLVFFPLMATLIVLQLSLIVHSATGGAYIAPLEYYTYPLPFLQFYLTPSTDLLAIFSLSTELWLVYLPFAVLLVSVAYAIWRWLFKPTVNTLADLLTRRDSAGLLSYYFLAGALFAVVLMGIAAYGPKSIVEWLSLPYAQSLASALSPLLLFLGLSVNSFKEVLHLMLLGVIFAMLSRVLVAIEPSFPRAAFAKTLTAISFLTIPALAVSPKFSETYYLSLASIGFSVIPFLAFCVIASLADWVVSRLAAQFSMSKTWKGTQK
jgi:hypothetical protein